MVKRNDWKYLIDACLFVDMGAIALIGLIMAFVIPPAKGTEGSRFFMGLHRHDWGDIHLYLSLLLLVLLVLHLWFNWTWVVQSTKSYFGERWQRVLWMLPAACLALIVLSWFLMLVS
jgi:hypothetical protein